MNHGACQDGADSRGLRRRTVAAVGIACICGWFVMELEILGVRVLAPYFGSAVYVVTGSVIGVFLLSLSVGYMLGGWLCGKVMGLPVLGVVLIAAGAWVCMLPVLIEPVCEMPFDLGLDEKWGSLLAALILFGVPSVLLGTVSPIIVHRLVIRRGRPGYYAGLVLSMSTAASFAGCVVTAFYLVLYSLRLTLHTSGVILGVLGAAVCVYEVFAAVRSASLVTKEPADEPTAA